MFVNIGVNGSDSLSIFNASDLADRFLLPFWGLMWIFAFVAFEVDVFRRLSAFWQEQDLRRFLDALRSPSEVLKALLAIIFALGFAAFSLGYYPFPRSPIPTVVYVLFWLFGWGVSGLIAWGLRQKPVQKTESQEGVVVGSIMGFVIGSVFFVVAYFFQPGLFYFHGMIGLGVVTMITCQVLFKASRNERMPNQALNRTSESRATRLSDSG
jgi:hypothetical protein